MKNILWIGGLIIIGIALLFLLGGSTTSSTKYELGVWNQVDNVKGVDPKVSSTTSVVIMEYSDFECPACRSYYPVVRQLVQEYGDRVTFVYRHFPLINIHANAEFAARATQASAKQGKFWEMHDLLFQKQEEWAKEADISKLFESYATLLGLNVDQFKIDFVSKEVKDFVKAQRVHALTSGIQGTPTFFIEGKKIENPNSLEAFRALIEEALKNKNQ